MIGLEDLFSRGGPVLYLLFLVTLSIWFIIISKYLSILYTNLNREKLFSLVFTNRSGFLIFGT